MDSHYTFACPKNDDTDSTDPYDSIYFSRTAGGFYNPSKIPLEKILQMREIENSKNNYVG